MYLKKLDYEILFFFQNLYFRHLLIFITRIVVINKQVVELIFKKICFFIIFVYYYS